MDASWPEFSTYFVAGVYMVLWVMGFNGGNMR